MPQGTRARSSTLVMRSGAPVHTQRRRRAAPSTRADATRTATSGARWPRSCWAASRCSRSTRPRARRRHRSRASCRRDRRRCRRRVRAHAQRTRRGGRRRRRQRRPARRRHGRRCWQAKRRRRQHARGSGRGRDGRCDGWRRCGGLDGVQCSRSVVGGGKEEVAVPAERCDRRAVAVDAERR